MKRCLLLAGGLFAVLPAGAARFAGPADPFLVSADAQAAPRRILWDLPCPVVRPDGAAGLRMPALPCDTFTSADVPPEGDMPRDVEFTRDGTAAVIVHTDSDNVTFFDIATRKIVATVPAGDYPTDLAVTPDNRLAVVPNVFGNSVSLIDIATRQKLADVPVTGEQPFTLAITPDSKYAIVAIINDGTNSAFSVVDLTAQVEVRNFPSTPQGVIGFFFTPESGISGALFTQFALSPDGDTIVLPDRAGNQVTLYSAASGAQLAALPTEAAPFGVAISTDGTLAVIAHEGAGRKLTKIDLVAKAVLGTVTASDTLDASIVRITPDKTHALAAISNNVIFLNLVSGAETKISTGVVGDIEFSFDGKYAFVSNFNARVIDVASKTLVKTIAFAACVDSAASPVEYRAVALNNRFRENIHLYNINGASGFFEGYAQSGEPPEGDATRDLALSADGRTLVANNNVSENTVLIDVPTGAVRAHIPTGDRPLAAAITPDNQYAVVCNTDSSTLSIIDLAAGVEVKNLPLLTRPSMIRISPDSQMAYVLTVTSGDRIAFVKLAGAASQEVGSVSSGETGSWMGPAYSAVSGIELSPDGAILAVCASFDDKLRLIDTASKTILTDVVVGDFPIRVAFTPDGLRAYVTNAFSDNVTAVAIDGAASHALATIPSVGKYPFVIVSDADGQYVYVGNVDGTTPAIKVISTATNTIVKSVSLTKTAARAAYLAADGILYVAGANATGSELIRLTAAGVETAILDRTPLQGSPSDMVFSEPLRTAILAQPVLDGVEFVRWRVPGDLNCDCLVNAFDIDPFVLALVDPAGYAAAFPDCDLLNGDINLDGGVDAFDIDPFVDLLVGQ